MQILPEISKQAFTFAQNKSAYQYLNCSDPVDVHSIAYWSSELNWLRIEEICRH